MNCIEFQQRLSSAVEAHVSSQDNLFAVSQHGESCEQAACQQLWTEYRLLLAIVPVWQASLPDISLTGGVISQLQQPLVSRATEIAASPLGTRTGHEAAREPGPSTNSPPRPSGRVREHRSARAVLALLSVVVCLLLIVPLLRLGGNAPQELANHAPDSGQPSDPPVDIPPTIATMNEAQVSEVMLGYARVPQSATEFVTDAMVMFIPADFSDPDDEEPNRPEQWRGRLGEQLEPLEPLGRELGTAVDAFLEVVAKSPMRST